MKYISKLLDPSGRFCCSRGFSNEFRATRQARMWSIGGGVSYVMNGGIRTIYKGGVKQLLNPTGENL